MKTTRITKPNPHRAELSKLDEAQHDKLTDWLLTGNSHASAAAMVKKEFDMCVSKQSIERFWSRFGPAIMDWQQLRPERITLLGWELNRRCAIKMLENPNLPFPQRRSLTIFLQTGHFPGANSRPSSTQANKSPRAASSDNFSDGFDEPNPLDDDVKLEKVRRLFIGTDSTEEPSHDASAAQQPPTSDSPAT